jgi:hypothetical protein
MDNVVKKAQLQANLWLLAVLKSKISVVLPPRTTDPTTIPLN